MKYSTYRLVLVAFYVLIAGLVSGAALFISFGTGVLLVAAFAVLGLIFLPIHFVIMGDRLRQYGGVFPHPSWDWPRYQWFRIVDDRLPTSDGTGSQDGGRPYPLCPNCRTVAATSTARYCHECGTPFATPGAADVSP